MDVELKGYIVYYGEENEIMISATDVNVTSNGDLEFSVSNSSYNQEIVAVFASGHWKAFIKAQG